ncbi:MAG: polysaccharide deacetylase family protein [Candidatus Omnitrophica bacterium]|nr:polysaccharide deacetylase family protein [Candidatus Omnitrophota bacterium]
MKKILIWTCLVLAILAVLGIVFLKTAYVVPVLMYHSIDERAGETKLSVTPESFARQMEFLKKNNYNVVGLDKIAAYMQGEEKVPPKTVAITFDDGYYNNYKYAFPALKKYNLPATIFVITDKIGRDGWVGWKEIKEMADFGIMTIGSHTKSHVWLPTLDDKRLKAEIYGSKDILEKGLGRRVDYFCYPLGGYDERVKEYVKEAGYKGACATNPGRFKPADDIYAIKRVRISRTSDNLLVFRIESSGYYTWVKEHRDE